MPLPKNTRNRHRMSITKSPQFRRSNSPGEQFRRSPSRWEQLRGSTSPEEQFLRSPSPWEQLRRINSSCKQFRRSRSPKDQLQASRSQRKQFRRNHFRKELTFHDKLSPLQSRGNASYSHKLTPPESPYRSGPLCRNTSPNYTIDPEHGLCDESDYSDEIISRYRSRSRSHSSREMSTNNKMQHFSGNSNQTVLLSDNTSNHSFGAENLRHSPSYISTSPRYFTDDNESLHWDEIGSRSQTEASQSNYTKDNVVKLSVSDKIAASVLKIVCRNGGRMVMDRLEIEASNYISNIESFREFLHDFPTIFTVVDAEMKEGEDGELQDNLVTAHTTIKLCSENPNREHRCSDLHVCKYFILSECRAKAGGMSCIFSHDLRDRHNKAVLKRNLLHKLSTKQVKSLICEFANRNKSTMPAVCRYYQTWNGCNGSNGSKSGSTIKQCQYIHICTYFLDHKCGFGAQCKRSHRLGNPQTKNILANFGILWSPDIENIILDCIRSAKDGTSLNRDTLSKLKQKMQRNKISPTLNRNTFGETVTWRFFNHSTKSWQDIEGNDSTEIEKRYQNFIEAGTYTMTYEGKSTELDFQKMKASVSGTDTNMDIKRSITFSYVQNVRV